MSKKPFRAFRFLFLLPALLFFSGSFSRAGAEVKLPSLFGDHMVFQQGIPLPVWGWSAPGEEIRVSLGGDVVSARADGRGRWKVVLPARKPGKPLTLRIQGDGSDIRLKDILVGEVWVCSGQSNMEMGIGMVKNAREEIQNARYPGIRLFLVPRTTSPNPESDVDASWKVCSPETIVQGGWKGFSACAYFFGRKLHLDLGVPVGLIQTCWGGSRIEAWTPPEGFSLVPNLRGLARMVWAHTPGTRTYRQEYAAYLEKMDAWLARARKALHAGEGVPLPPGAPEILPQGRKGITGLYNAMVHPLLPFAVRGAIWYQGEANNGDGMLYFKKMQALVRGWRRLWGEGAFPFYFVQIAPYRYGGAHTPYDLPELWEAQEAAQAIPNTGMAGTMDIGNVRNIHPKNKQEAGRRLALWALARTYGRPGLVYRCPSFDSMTVEGNKARVLFDHCGGGLVSRDGKPLSWFEAAGPDRVFVKAKAEISGKNSVLVWSEKVPSPKFVRFAWNQEAQPNLASREGLPALPFRSDRAAYRIPPGPNLAWGRPYRCSDPNPYRYGGTGALTDGSWLPDNKHCFATGKSPRFPKSVTVDLGKVYPVAAVRLGVPPFGSTREVRIALSGNGKKFAFAAAHVFPFGRAEKTVLRFGPIKARFVRVIFTGHYAKKKGYDPNFMFLTELEVYPAEKKRRK